MKRERRSFSKEFKLIAVELCQSGKSNREVAEGLDIRDDLVGLCNREFGKYKEGSFSGHGNVNLTGDHFCLLLRRIVDARSKTLS